MNEIVLTPEMLTLVPVVAAVLQMAKSIEMLANLKQWFPLVSLVLGVVACYITGVPNPIMPGVLIGLSASAGYDVLKLKKPKGETE